MILQKKKFNLGEHLSHAPTHFIALVLQKVVVTFLPFNLKFTSWLIFYFRNSFRNEILNIV